MTKKAETAADVVAQTGEVEIPQTSSVINMTGMAPNWMRLLGKSEVGGRDYVPRVEGQVPATLKGSLYRNGPGLFERGSMSVKHMLDGDGLIQRLSFTDYGVRYQNRFVETEKYQAEQAAGKRLHSTWTTRKAANPFSNLGGGTMQSQAGVTVYPVFGRLLARDELGPSYEIDPETLATRGQMALPDGLEKVGFKAHSKTDPETGDWIMAGSQFGRANKIHAAIYGPHFRLKTQIAFETPRRVYIHDFLVSKEHLIFILHPCMFTPMPYLMGLKSFTDSFRWKQDEGNLVAVVSRAGGEPKFFDAPGAFMWHALNAFEDGGDIIADFVGYDDPDHFIGENPMLETLMRGQMGKANVPGKIRRYRINMNGGVLTEEILDEGNHEFPMIDERASMKRHDVGYFASGGLAGFNSGLKRLDYNTGKSQEYNFGDEVQIGEPVFAPKAGGKTDQGWLVSQCLDAASQTTFFGVFDAKTVDKGPVAKVWLDHHVPISFHGAWYGS